jgi:hypothetical protein
VSQSHQYSSFLRLLCHVTLATAAIVTVCRTAQLALAPAGVAKESHQPSAPGSAGGSYGSFAQQCDYSGSAPGKAGGYKALAISPASAAQADAELAELYKACPLAAVIDLKTVADSPEKVDAILPPYRELADHVATTSPAPDVPRIHYPIRLQTSNPRIAPGSAGGLELRIAQVPRVASKPPAARGDWLIDPKDWLTPAEESPADVGGVSDADKAHQSSTPSASEKPSTETKPSTEPVLTTTPSESSTDADVAPHTSPLAPSSPPQPLFTPPAPAAATPAEQLPVPAGTPPFSPPPAPTDAAAADASAKSGGKPPAVDPHLELYTKSAYPSARECAVCHEEIYQQWSVSAHAYAAVSPMFNKFEQRLNDLSQGTVGYFCMRCHAPVATSLCASRAQPLWTLPEAAREGITCVACHRVQYAYGKSNGERRIETGDINAPVFGGIGGDGVAQVIAEKDKFKVKTGPDEKGPGQNIHISGIYFQPLTRSEFCTPCHQVAVYPGIKLEVVWEQYRASPACKKGIQCQDCHMGKVPGVAAGYECGPVAKVAGKTVNDNRKKSNHIFFGPNYSIAHPGVFPFNLKANRWTMDQWLTFDWRAGWGTKEFESQVADQKIHVTFPPLWAEADDRADAREIIDDNLKKLNQKRELRVQVMENGSHIEGPIFDSPPCRGQDLNLHYIVTNTNDGHNLVTASLGAQPQLWANIVLIGPDGSRLWETGYTDSSGDLANIHSHDVRNKLIPFDWQLFNLQTMFLITGVKGTDREFFVPVNLDIDQLPFIRPGTQPISVLNHPPFIRMESQSLAALGSRQVPYRIPGKLIQQPGRYRLSFRMRSRSEPIYFMRFCGATEEMERSMNEWMIDLHPSSVEFEVR